MDGQDFKLADAIDVVRAELQEAQNRGRDADVRFSIGSVQVELAIELTKTAGGGLSINVLNLLSIGGKGEVSRAGTNQITISLVPVGVDGRPFEVGSAQIHRPDGNSDREIGGDDSLESGRPGG